MVIISVGKHVADRLRFVNGLLIAEAVMQEEIVCGASALYQSLLLLGWDRLLFSCMVQVEYMTERKEICKVHCLVFSVNTQFILASMLMFFSSCSFVGQIRQRPYF
jgi:hypothetical protein